jgi:hypothetical protein
MASQPPDMKQVRAKISEKKNRETKMVSPLTEGGKTPLGKGTANSKRRQTGNIRDSHSE